MTENVTMTEAEAFSDLVKNLALLATVLEKNLKWLEGEIAEGREDREESIKMGLERGGMDESDAQQEREFVTVLFHDLRIQKVMDNIRNGSEFCSFASKWLSQYRMEDRA
ncbi:hypothetical protein DKP76_10460 [Falsochrobactrum shanghaiense]|uniref:Uncharacterized protein n=1 Tax=Falsochrobactrum shanghaiense TaxID=2201899 RepID=A0A316J860_9HYPH|nr:hypothetical protein [Falsochrobactrum shanghaiense]PWL18132.1 hypothetical protein DKP76_10460 [Falsochrobactrum shanghaiense]